MRKDKIIFSADDLLKAKNSLGKASEEIQKKSINSNVQTAAKQLSEECKKFNTTDAEHLEKFIKNAIYEEVPESIFCETCNEDHMTKNMIQCKGCKKFHCDPRLRT